MNHQRPLPQKTEWLKQEGCSKVLENHEAAKFEVLEDIEVFYSQLRRHSFG